MAIPEGKAVKSRDGLELAVSALSCAAGYLKSGSGNNNILAAGRFTIMVSDGARGRRLTSHVTRVVLMLHMPV